MSEIPLCRIAISSQLHPDDIEFLKTSLSPDSIKVQNPPSRVLGADDILFVLAVIGGIDASTNCISKLVKVLKDWRKKMREKGKELKGTLEQPKLQLPP